MKNILLVLSLCFLGGCIQPFEVEVDEGEKKLVVNGLITDEPGPYTVKINKTTSYGGFFSDVDPSVLDAVVTITDESGNMEVLRQTAEGEFKTLTTGMRGRVGGKYTLRIRLKNGKEYVSETETINPVPAIERLNFAYNEIVKVDKDNNEIREPVFELQLNLKDPAGEKNFYKYVSVGTYEVETQPENYKVLDKRGNYIPKPKDCCRQCWVTRVDYTTHVISDRQFNGHSLLNHVVGAIPITPKYLGIKYHVELKQLSLSEKAYAFWQMIENQTSGTGSVQEPAPANAPSNIHNTADANEQVVGFFGASAVAKKSFYIRNTDVPFLMQKFEFADDCRELPGATTTKPSFWQ